METLPITANQYKIVLVGDGGVGKTAILHSIKGCDFEKRYIATVGCEVHPIYMKPSSLTSYAFYDTAGQEKYGGKFTNYLKGANLAVIVYDVTNRISYKNVSQWYKKIRSESPTVPVVLVANKTDCLTKKIVDPTFHSENGLQYFEVSAKTGENIETLLEYMMYTCA
jgi:GTP-binding nuclear protein Ran